LRQRLDLLALGAIFGLWVGTATPSLAQTEHSGHNEAHQSLKDAQDKMLAEMMAGMTDTEKERLRGHISQIPTAHRQIMIDHLKRMSPTERRKMAEQIARGGGAEMMHNNGSLNTHVGHRTGNAPGPAPLAIGDQVPDFEVRDLQGKTHRLSDYRKQTKSGVVSLTFWCSFCDSCRVVEDRLNRFAQENKSRSVVAAIDASAGETAAGVSAFAKKKGLALPILIDAPGKAADLFGVKVTTTTVVIDRNGILCYRGRFLDGDKALAGDALNAVLAGKPVNLKETPQRG
jgi:peroxiredoxin